MVELEPRQLASVIDQWLHTTREAIQLGAEEGRLHSMLTMEATAAEEHHCQPPPPDPSGPETIYTELPDGLITVPEAARKYQINRRTIQTWLNQNRLERKGRMRGSARGGGFVLIDECELVRYMNTPKNRGGRPRKS